MALSPRLQEKVEVLADELRRELYGPKGIPAVGDKVRGHGTADR